LQALVSEPLKPCIDCVINAGFLNCYVSQSDKGELVIGGARDSYVSYAQRGSFHVTERILVDLLELFPIISRVKQMRQWAGIVDCSPDMSPIIGATPVENLFVNCGWGTGGFKATPGSGFLYAHHIARGAPHPLAAPFGLDRFAAGRLVNEAAAAGVGH
jgi:sarcosine oxidase subunit beta